MLKDKKIKQARSLHIAVAVALLLLTACGSRRGGPALKDIPGDRPVQTVTDDLGRQVTVPLNVKRIVSTAPSVTENIFAIGAADRLVGVTTFCNYPEEAQSIAKIGDTMNPNMEAIVALKPDIVFVSTASQIEAFTSTLEQNGIAVYVTNPLSFSDVIEELKKLAGILGTEDRANQVINALIEREKTVHQAVGTYRLNGEDDTAYDRRVQTVRVFLQISDEPLFTIGQGAFLNNLIEAAGGRSVTADVETAYPKLSKETAVALKPDAIILSDSPDNQQPNEAFKNSPAVKNGRVYKINADIISRPGPRLVDALEQIAKDLHPEKFH